MEEAENWPRDGLGRCPLSQTGMPIHPPACRHYYESSESFRRTVPMANGELNHVLHLLRELTGAAAAEGASDGQLLRYFAAQRDEAAFRLMVERHGPMVLGVCRRILGHLYDAEDVFQATFLVLARRAGTIARQESVGSWLHGVAHRLALKARGQAARRRERERQVATVPYTHPLPEIETRELRAVLDEEIGRLPKKYQAPLILCDLEGKTHAQAAQELGWPAGSMSRWLARGRELLGERLARRGLALPAGGLAAVLTADVARAAVPGALADATARGAVLFAAGQAGAGPAAAALAEGALRTLFLTRLTIATLVLLMVGIAGGASLLRVPAPADEQTARVAVAPLHRAAAGADLPPAEGNQARADHLGDPLPDEAIARLGTVRFRHGSAISALAMSTDGKVVASAGWGEAIYLWDVATGKQLHRIDLPLVTALAFSPDGKVLAAGEHDLAISLWDVASGELLRQCWGQTAVKAVVFTPDGTRFLSGGGDGIIREWDVATGKHLRDLEGRPIMHHLAVSPDGKTLAAGGDAGTISVWERATGKQLRLLPTNGSIYGLAFASDGKTVASASRDEPAVRLWDWTTGKVIRRLEGPPVRSLAFGADGKTLVAGGDHDDGTVRVWDWTTGKEVRRFQAEPGDGEHLALAAHGRTVVVGGANHTLRFWDLATGREAHSAPGHQRPVSAVAFSSDGKVLASGGIGGTVCLWDPATGRELRRFGAGAGGFATVVFAPGDRTLASTGTDHLIHLWDVATGMEVRRYQVPAGRLPTCLAFAPDGKTLAVGYDQVIALIDAGTGGERHRLRGHRPPDSVSCVAFSPDGRTLASGSWDQTVRLWDVATGAELHRLDGHKGRLCTLAWSPDGKVLTSSAQDQAVRVWNVATGKEMGQLPTPVEGFHAQAFSPDGKTLAWGGSYGDRTVRVVDVLSGQEVCRFVGHAGPVNGVALSPDGRTVASAGDDTTVLIWDVTGRLRDGKLWPAQVSLVELDLLWTDLGGDDAARARRAFWTLASAPRQAVPFLQAQLGPDAAAEPEHVARLIAALDDDRFTVREKATVALERLGLVAEPALRKALAKQPSAEVRRRAERLLEKLTKVPPARRLQRAVSVLEHINTPAARQVLEALAHATPQTDVAREAKAALQRLSRQTSPRP
jgi:RNA polymerase sigma factor (sigma-70 family)